MILRIISIFSVLLFCARGAEPKIVYSRPQRNDTFTGSTKSDDNETAAAAMAAVTVNTTAAPSVPSTGRRYADNSMSMTSNADVYGLQFFAPPVVHRPAVHTVVDQLYGLPAHPLHHHHLRPTAAAYLQNSRHAHQQQHQRQQRPDGGGGGTSAEPVPILMNPPLQVAAHEDPSTVRYSPPRHRLHVRLHAEPAAATLAYQLPLLAAESDDVVLLNDLPALRFALQHAAGKVHAPPSAINAAGQQPYVLPHRRHVAKQPVTSPHQLYAQPHQTAAPHHNGLHHRYAASRYTQVPFLYSLPAPPPAQRHGRLVPAGEYDLVARFNRLLRQRERNSGGNGGGGGGDDDDDGGDRNQRRPAAGGDDDDDEEAVTRPAVKPKKKTKKKKKKQKKRMKKKQPRPTATPAPVEEEHEDYADDGPPSRQDQEDDDTAPTNEEQESQNVPTREKLPQSTVIQETEADFEDDEDEPTKLSEQFGGDLTFEDGNGERVEFQLHGLGGPDSYKFGFDTGKGTNRQFRYEERDSSGFVHGHYGYLDQDGKMQMYNYSSHPELGFHSEKAKSPEM